MDCVNGDGNDFNRFSFEWRFSNTTLRTGQDRRREGGNGGVGGPWPAKFSFNDKLLKGDAHWKQVPEQKSLDLRKKNNSFCLTYFFCIN